MLFCDDLSVQRRTVWTRTRTEPDLKAGLDQDELLSLRYKVRAMIPGRSIVQSIVLVLVLLGSLVQVDGYLNEDQEELLVELHNRYRGVVQPSASAMLPLKWDGNLKILAEKYAATCVWNHNPELEDTGENLYVGTGELDLERALEKWFLEKADYSYYNNSCEEDKMCGHYTQMVWADTHRVGCAVHLCAQMEGLGWSDPTHFLVCNYFPAGNYEGERPYVEGDWCSQCPEDFQRCLNNLCAPEVEPTEPEPEEETIETGTASVEEPDSVTDSPVVLVPEPTQDSEQNPDENTEPTPVQDTDDPNETIEQEAAVPPPATESIPPEPLVTPTPEETETGLQTEPESEDKIEPETPKEDPTRGPAGGAQGHIEEKQKVTLLTLSLFYSMWTYQAD
ncbi:peptidase inhibitor 16-like [Boleophthalmus pectinirostris]|uniref:peptidase inhibitor 16-like n=1 Tax=Boleophthalmus pectinirostris TaxID=150288 RepID=UPI00242D78A0|nr:peptidase inhibitor 16-like [Boleophthalmus pectinirostris]